MQTFTIDAYAKINLGLDVLRRRPDGYHEVRMIMQTVDLYDTIRLERTKEPGITLEVDSQEIPTDAHNLAYRAAKLLAEEQNLTEGMIIRLTKRIPVAAGMAGGSTDAAAVLMGVNRLFDLGLTEVQLMERGVRLGADVPYCVMGGTALAEGIGEKLTRLSAAPRFPVLIAKPPISVSTKMVYENLILNDGTPHPDIDRILQAIEKGDGAAMAGAMGNVLETVTGPRYPVIGQIEKAMLQCGAVHAMMSGSGPTVFGLFDDETTARSAYETLRAQNLAKDIYLTNFIM